MTSQPNQSCVCGHGLDEHQRESMACQYRICPCAHFIGEFPELQSDRDEVNAQRVLSEVVSALKSAHQLATQARNEVERCLHAYAQPIEMDQFIDIFPIATLNLTAAMNMVEIIVDGLSKQEATDAANA